LRWRNTKWGTVSPTGGNPLPELAILCLRNLYPINCWVLNPVLLFHCPIRLHFAAFVSLLMWCLHPFPSSILKNRICIFHSSHRVTNNFTLTTNYYHHWIFLATIPYLEYNTTSMILPWHIKAHHIAAFSLIIEKRL
jgi:hypothetical protein